MDLREIFELQREFDESAFPAFARRSPESAERVRDLAFLALSALGELGEVANHIKKVYRGDFELAAVLPDLELEVADVFIYVIKICQQLGLDLEDAYLKKLAENRTRFAARPGSKGGTMASSARDGSPSAFTVGDLLTIKAASARSIDALVDGIITDISDQAATAGEIRAHVVAENVPNPPGTDLELLFSAALSVVLADIGRAYAPETREEGLAKIADVCEAHLLELAFVEGMARHASIWESILRAAQTS